MNLSRNFTLQELTKSDTAVRLGVDNNPNANQIEKLKLLCENILQPVRDHFGPVTITSGFRSPALCVKIGRIRYLQLDESDKKWIRDNIKNG
jgi:zinc D-Ala-D-Ala carboxypeptidase